MRTTGSQQKGFSLVEMMITVAVFGIIATVAMGAFISQLETNSREYNLAESEIETNIALNNLLSTDITMAGFGLANDYPVHANGPGDWEAIALEATDSAAGDDLTLRGTALGINSRATKSWSYYHGGKFVEWPDAPREDLVIYPTNNIKDDVFILLDPNSKTLLAKGPDATVKSEWTPGSAEWLFRGNTPVTLFGDKPFVDIPSGALAYGLNKAEIGSGKIKEDNEDGDLEERDIVPADLLPYYVVRYYLGGDSPAVCAPGTSSLLRAETMLKARSDQVGEPKWGRPIMACVRNLQVAFGLDTNDDGTVDLWDNGGQILKEYSFEDQRRRIKQVRLFLLVQQGRRDPDYQYPNSKILVGDTKPAMGEEVTLSDEQRRYRWRLLTLSVVPKNIRW